MDSFHHASLPINNPIFSEHFLLILSFQQVFLSASEYQGKSSGLRACFPRSDNRRQF